MKAVILLGVLGFVAIVSARPDDKYTTKYDNVDLDDILKNKRLLKGYVFCLLEKGPCSPDGAELKKVLPDAIETECSKCSEKQNNGSRKVLRHLIDNEPEYWNELEKKYDPKGEYKNKYREEAKKEGINL
ncbi:Insect pheromone-binding family, A10/OS-D [Popillia japonica]|uniref:Insect pheromone-binding family, A10/OS-D n=1 Tax=Popillia japonica TaxID=7064 RepID=A0AAW1KQ08_POPJA